jgi:hypothetical protein
MYGMCWRWNAMADESNTAWTSQRISKGMVENGARLDRDHGKDGGPHRGLTFGGARWRPAGQAETWNFADHFPRVIISLDDVRLPYGTTLTKCSLKTASSTWHCVMCRISEDAYTGLSQDGGADLGASEGIAAWVHA